MKTKVKGLALLLFVAMAASPLYAQTADTANQQSQQPQKEGVGEEAGYGIGSALANVFYIPAKVTYAGLGLITGGDRKSTRLNSSHQIISYAVFCLKKK